MPVDAGDFGGNRIAERRRRGFGRFVRVQTNTDVDLGGVVPLEGAQVVADGDHAGELYRRRTARYLTVCGLPLRSARCPDRRRPAGGTLRNVASVEGTAAELATIADNVAQYRTRVAGLAEPFVGSDRDDLVVAIHEAERQLRVAERSLTRALRALR